MKKISIKSILALNKIFEKIISLSLPLKTAYKLTLLKKEISKNVEFYEQEYKKIIQNYCILESLDNNRLKIQEGKEQECIEKIQELEDMEIEIPDFKFALNELEKIQPTVEEMEALLPFIKEGE